MIITNDIDMWSQKISATSYEVTQAREESELYKKQKSGLEGYIYHTGDHFRVEEDVVEQYTRSFSNNNSNAVIETINGYIESIQGEIALVVFETPNGYLERYVSIDRLKVKNAAYPGARIQLTSKQYGSQTITDIENVDSDIPPAWDYDDTKIVDFFAKNKF